MDDLSGLLEAFGLVGRRKWAAAVQEMSGDIYPSTTWTFTNSAREIVTKFADGNDRNRIYATGTTSVSHLLQRAFAVSASTAYTLSIVGQADTVSTFLGFEFYNGSTFLESAGRFNPTTGVAEGTGVGTLTSLGGGLYRYDRSYTTPAKMTILNVRLMVGNSAGTGSFVANGEGLFTGVLTLGTGTVDAGTGVIT